MKMTGSYCRILKYSRYNQAGFQEKEVHFPKKCKISTFFRACKIFVNSRMFLSYYFLRLENSVNTNCRSFRVEINCSKLIIDNFDNGAT